jgi:hypothetical protein
MVVTGQKKCLNFDFKNLNEQEFNMKDHYYIDENENKIAVADLPLETVEELIRDGVEISNAEHGETVEGVLERLKIELVVRRLQSYSNPNER